MPLGDIRAHLAKMSELYEASDGGLAGIYALLATLSPESLPGALFLPPA